jgi:hypothetical protein
MRCLETVLRDVEREVDIPATILLPDDPRPQTFVSTALVTAMCGLLDEIETRAEGEGDEDLADLCRVRFEIMVAHGLVLSFEAPTSDAVH